MARASINLRSTSFSLNQHLFHRKKLIWTCTQADGRQQRLDGLSKTRSDLPFTTPTFIRTRKEPKLATFRPQSKLESSLSQQLKLRTGSSLHERTQALAFMTNRRLLKKRRILVHKAIPASLALKFPTVKIKRLKIRNNRDQATTPTCSRRRLLVSSVYRTTLLEIQSLVQAPRPEATRISIHS